MVDPRKAERIEFIDFDASCSQRLNMLLFQWLIVGCVAERIEEGAYLHTFLRFFGEEVEEGISYGVIAEVEVFKMY